MHGAWSIGTLLGGLTSSWAARADLSFRVHLTVVAIALAAATLVARHWLLPSARRARRSEEHTSELQSLMRISYAVSCFKKTTHRTRLRSHNNIQHHQSTTLLTIS